MGVRGKRGGFNEQEAANRLIDRVGGRFRYVPGFPCPGWFVRRGDHWDPLGAFATLRLEYVGLWAELPDDPELAARVAHEAGIATTAEVQRRVLWLVEHDPRMVFSPEDFDSNLRPLYQATGFSQTLQHFSRESNPTPGIPSDPTLKPIKASEPTLETIESNQEFLQFACAYFPENPAILAHFFGLALEKNHGHVCTHVPGKNSWLLLRCHSSCPDPDPLADYLESLYGERIYRMPAPLWNNWPHGLTPALAQRLTGVAVAFLDSVDFPRQIRPESLRRLVCHDWASWQGRDGNTYRLSLPGCFVLCGFPQSRGWFSTDLRPAILEIPRGPEAEDATD